VSKPRATNVGRSFRAAGSENSLIPQKLQDLLDTFDMFSDPADRTSMLLSYADQFQDVPANVAVRPFDCTHRVPQCESDAYAWAIKRPDDTLKLYFAVENPSGVSAKALATILDRTLSGLPAEQVAQVPMDIVERIFRQNISMGKGIGLMSMVQAVQALAKAASNGAQSRR
jgi:cysteine desulfuration protein SufE